MATSTNRPPAGEERDQCPVDFPMTRAGTRRLLAAGAELSTAVSAAAA